MAPLLRVSSIVISIGTGWLIFMYLYTVLPETREPWSVVRRGALLGSIALVALQFVASFLISAFRGNPAAVIFGPVIVLMLFFNLFAQLVLFVAAWIATAQHEAVPVPAEEESTAPPERKDQQEEVPNVVPKAVAVRSVRAGMGAGYVTGAATGVGTRCGTRATRCQPYGAARNPDWSVRSSELSAGLADVVQQCREPRCGNVERLAALDPVELDGPELIAAFLIMPNQARLTT